MALDLDIRQTKALIKMQLEHTFQDIPSEFRDIQKVYINSNEDLQMLLKTINVKEGTSAFSILAGGDMPFSLVGQGIYQIATGDLNNLTPYMALGLKKAMLGKYNYQEYLQTLAKLYDSNISLETLTKIIEDLMVLMEADYQEFWQAIVKYNYDLQAYKVKPINLMYLLGRLRNSNTSLDFIHLIPYLNDEVSYEKLQNNLAKAEITFINLDVLNDYQRIKGKYDLIYLSNILDYAYVTWGNNWDYAKLKEYINNIMAHLNGNGLLLLHYIFSKHLLMNSTELFDESAVTLNDLKLEEVIAWPDNPDRLLIRQKRV